MPLEWVIFMDEILNRIISIEHKAQDIIEDAENQKRTMFENLKKECSKIKNNIMERQQRRIEIIKQTEQKFADEKMAEIDKSTQESIKKLDCVFNEKKEEWVQNIYNNIIGR